MNSEATAPILLLDTSDDAGRMVLAVDGEVRSIVKMERARDYAAVLNDTVEVALKNGGVTMNELTVLCVLAGPGSYTGLRIALAAAKGWCYALEIPLTLQNKLHVLAEEARAAQPGYETYFAILPARTGEYFFAAYGPAGDALVNPRHLKLSEAADILARLPQEYFVIGSETSATEIFSSENFSPQPPTILTRESPSTEAWLNVALAQIRAGDFMDLAYAEPFYLKAAYTTTPKTSR